MSTSSTESRPLRPSSRAVASSLERRQRGQRPEVIDCAWRARRRGHQRWQRLEHERGKRGGVVAVAVARELVGFCWEIALMD